MTYIHDAFVWIRVCACLYWISVMQVHVLRVMHSRLCWYMYLYVSCNVIDWHAVQSACSLSLCVCFFFLYGSHKKKNTFNLDLRYEVKKDSVWCYRNSFTARFQFPTIENRIGVMWCLVMSVRVSVTLVYLAILVKALWRRGSVSHRRLSMWIPPESHLSAFVHLQYQSGLSWKNCVSLKA